MAFFSTLNHYFISSRLLRDRASDKRQRATVMVGVLAVSALSGLGMALALLVAYLLNGESLFLTASLMAALAVTGYASALWLFRRQQNLLSAASLYGATATFSTVGPCLITGGISVSPYSTLILIVPIFMFLMAGRRHGMYWTGVTVLSVSVLLLLESVGVQFPQLIPENLMGNLNFSTWLLTLALLVLGLALYENNFETLNKRLSIERSHFAYEALHDPLTGLSNRKLFFTRAEEAIAHAMSREHKAAVIYVDLDDFKRINDGFGHNTGDEVLNAVAQRLQANVRSMDTVARLGGDEFAVVLHGIEGADIAERMVEKLRAVLKEPFQIGDLSFNATGSMGVAVAPDQAQDADHLLRMADEAMYRAKESRVNLAC